MTQPSAPASRSWQDRFSLRDRVVLLTGAAGGIGSVFAWALAEAGAVAAATDRSLELLGPLGERLAGEGLAISPYAADLASVDECRRLVADGSR